MSKIIVIHRYFGIWVNCLHTITNNYIFQWKEDVLFVKISQAISRTTLIPIMGTFFPQKGRYQQQLLTAIWRLLSVYHCRLVHSGGEAWKFTQGRRGRTMWSYGVTPSKTHRLWAICFAALSKQIFVCPPHTFLKMGREGGSCFFFLFKHSIAQRFRQ